MCIIDYKTANIQKRLKLKMFRIANCRITIIPIYRFHDHRAEATEAAADVTRPEADDESERSRLASNDGDVE